MKNKVKKTDKSTLGLYIKVVSLDTPGLTNRELAKEISETYGIDCTKEDIDNYQMNFIAEDWEKESRMINFGINPEL